VVTAANERSSAAGLARWTRWEYLDRAGLPRADHLEAAERENNGKPPVRGPVHTKSPPGVKDIPLPTRR
jgi:hypothetical protein